MCPRDSKYIGIHVSKRVFEKFHEINRSEFCVRTQNQRHIVVKHFLCFPLVWMIGVSFQGVQEVVERSCLSFRLSPSKFLLPGPISRIDYQCRNFLLLLPTSINTSNDNLSPLKKVFRYGYVPEPSHNQNGRNLDQQVTQRTPNATCNQNDNDKPIRKARACRSKIVGRLVPPFEQPLLDIVKPHPKVACTSQNLTQS